MYRQRDQVPIADGAYIGAYIADGGFIGACTADSDFIERRTLGN